MFESTRKERRRVGRIEQFIHSYGFAIGGFSILLTFPALLIYSGGNLYISIPGTLGIPILVFSLPGYYVYRKTGRWWFRRLPKHLPLEPPKYNLPIANFFRRVEQALNDEPGPVQSSGRELAYSIVDVNM